MPIPPSNFPAAFAPGLADAVLPGAFVCVTGQTLVPAVELPGTTVENTELLVIVMVVTRSENVVVSFPAASSARAWPITILFGGILVIAKPRLSQRVVGRGAPEVSVSV